MTHFVAEQKTKKKPYSNVTKNKKKIGKKTGRKTKRGRDIYKVREDHPMAGENVSELGVTIPIAAETTTGDEVWLNTPSLHEGSEYSEDELKQMYQEDKLIPEETSLHGSIEEGTEASIKRSEELDEFP
tara:strand:- start:294 stop:680 length:387 start_codon:yes stop_codon:yes gene_type:complete